MAEILELMADDESHQVGKSEASDDLRGAVADSGRMIEGRIEFRAADFDPRGAITGEKAVEPMRWAIERAAEIE